MDPTRLALFAALTSSLSACSGAGSESSSGLEASKAIVRHEVVRDTQHVVIQETLRTVVSDTVRTVVTDTQRTVIVDTVRTVLMRSPPPTKAASQPATVDRISPNEDEIRAAIEQMKLGRVSSATIAVLTDGIPSFVTVSAGELDSGQLVLLRSLVGLDDSELSKVRWGRTLAPQGSPDYKAKFMTVWTVAGDRSTVKIDTTGIIRSSGI